MYSNMGLIAQVVADRTPAQLRTQVEYLEAAMRSREAHTGAYLETMQLEHFFKAQIYIRKIHMRAGLIVISKVHRDESFSIVSKGAVALGTEAGPVVVRGGDHFHAPPETKRILLILEDAIWTTIHLNLDDCRDLSVLESRYIVPETNQISAEEFAALRQSMGVGSDGAQ